MRCSEQQISPQTYPAVGLQQRPPQASQTPQYPIPASRQQGSRINVYVGGTHLPDSTECMMVLVYVIVVTSTNLYGP